ncbi:MAG: MFS transporter [Blastocatellia bacterium]
MTRKDPVEDLTLLKERNFALAGAPCFMVFFTLFESTLLVPLMLQNLFAYTATDAGLVLSPGAIVIVVLVPLVVMISKRVQPRWTMAFGLMICTLAVFSMTGLNLNGDYNSFVIPRMVLGARACVPVYPTQPDRLLVPAAGEEQQGFEPDQPVQKRAVASASPSSRRCSLGPVSFIKACSDRTSRLRPGCRSDAAR